MSEHLDKAKGALDEARSHVPDRSEGVTNLTGSELHFGDLLRIANVQAAVAQAEAAERQADALESIESILSGLLG